MQKYARANLLSAAKRCRCMHVALIAACAPLTMTEECTSRMRVCFFFLSFPQKIEEKIFLLLFVFFVSR